MLQMQRFRDIKENYPISSKQLVSKLTGAR
jgi:hypothetical protein